MHIKRLKPNVHKSVLGAMCLTIDIDDDDEIRLQSPTPTPITVTTPEKLIHVQIGNYCHVSRLFLKFNVKFHYVHHTDH